MVHVHMSAESESGDVDRLESICDVHDMQRLAHKTERQLINDQEDEAEATLEELRDEIDEFLGA